MNDNKEESTEEFIKRIKKILIKSKKLVKALKAQKEKEKNKK